MSDELTEKARKIACVHPVCDHVNGAEHSKACNYFTQAIASALREERERTVRLLCRECANGDVPKYDPKLKYWYHMFGDDCSIGCTASAIRNRGEAFDDFRQAAQQQERTVSPSALQSGDSAEAMLTGLERKMLDFITSYLRTHEGQSPTLAEIGEGCGVSSVGTIHRYVSSIEAKGFLTKARSGWRTRRIAQAALQSDSGGEAIVPSLRDSVAYVAGQNDFAAGTPFTKGDELWSVFREDWQRGWSDAKAANAQAQVKSEPKVSDEVEALPASVGLKPKTTP